MSAKGQVRKVVSKLNKLEKTLRSKVESGALFNEVKQFADSKSKILRQKVKTNRDLKKVIGIVEQRRRQIEKVARVLPKEVKIVRSYIQTQKKELERLGDRLFKTMNEKSAGSAGAAKKSTRKKATRKTTKKRKK